MDQKPAIDLIVLDIKMVPLDGIQILKKMRAKKIGVPVILYSDFSHYKRELSTWLADAFLVKSSDLTELKQKVRELLRLSASGGPT